MKYSYNINFFDSLEEAFIFQNEHGGTLYIKGEDSKTDIEYTIATYLTNIDDEEELEKLGKYVVVDDFVRYRVIERNCFRTE